MTRSKAGKSVCLITPGHLSTNPRLVKEADALTEAGYTVQVVSADFADWARVADREFEGRVWRAAARLRFGPGTPAPQRIVQLLRQRVARLMFRAGFWRPGVVCAAWHPIGPDLVATASAVAADLYVAHYPAALPAAAIAACANDARYAFDAEDFHLGDPPEAPAHDGTRALIRSIESRYLPACTYVTAAAPGIAGAYIDVYGISRPTVLLNVFPLAQAPAGPTPRGETRPGPSVYWFSQTIGADRGLECAVRALGLTRTRPHLYLRGNPQPEFIGQLQRIAAESGVADRLHILPLASPSMMEHLAAQYDIGLVGETGFTLNHRIALGNKLFTYVLAGVPAVISDIPAHRDFAAQAGDAVRLYPVEDPVGLATALDELLAGDGTTLATARAQAYALGQQRFNWDLEKTKLLHLVGEALS